MTPGEPHVDTRLYERSQYRYTTGILPVYSIRVQKHLGDTRTYLSGTVPYTRTLLRHTLKCTPQRPCARRYMYPVDMKSC